MANETWWKQNTLHLRFPLQAVEDTVLSNGGEIYQRDTQAGGLAERLVMTVALPYLWGLPPAFDTLRCHTLLHA